MLEYTILVLAFVATLVGVLGKTTHEHLSWPQNLTKLGWATLVLSAVTLIASIAIKHENEREKLRAQYWAFRELEFATYRLLVPYIDHFEELTDNDRFHVAEGMNSGDEFRLFSDTTDLRSSANRFHVSWGSISTDATKEAYTAMGEILARYAAVLPVETVEFVSRVRTDPWVQIMLDAHRRELLPIREGEKARFYAPRASSKKGNGDAAAAFGRLMQKLEVHLGEKLPEAAKELGIVDEPGFFFPLQRVKQLSAPE